MKKGLLFLYLGFISLTLLPAQDVDTQIRDAVNNLAARFNVTLDVSIGAVMMDGTNTPSAFSRFLSERVSHFAANNDMLRVIPLTRGLPAIRPTMPRQGHITGSFMLLGDRVDITLRMVSDTGGETLGSQNFSIPAAELSRMGIAIEPENMQAVREREQILEDIAPSVQDYSPPPPAPAAHAAPRQALEIAAWPNTDTFTFIDGEELRITLVANQNSYFKVFHIDIYNQMQLIFPNSVNRNNFIQANQPRTIPDAPVWFRVQAPFGQDTIIVVASSRQFTNLEETIGGQPVRLSHEAMLARGIGIQIGPAPQHEAVETASVRFNFTSLPAIWQHRQR